MSLAFDAFAARRPRAARRIAVALLALGQTIAWAGLYYLFAALLLSWERELGWAKTDLALALTVAVLVAAATAPVAGRAVDAGFGRWLLGFGALSGAGLVAALSQITTQGAFLVVWALIGLTQGTCLYEACFAFVTRTLGTEARAAITRITLVAGFASTLAFPLAGGLAETSGWRTAALVFSGAVGLVAAPMLLAGATLLQAGAGPAPALHRAQNRAAVRAALRRPVFWLIAGGFAMIALNHGILLNHLLPLLNERGMAPATAILAASAIGPMQVFGRLMMLSVERRVGALTLSLACFAAVAAAGLILLWAGAAVTMVFAFVALQGAGYGVTSVLKPIVTAECLGREGFGGIAGWMAVPYLAGFALAPYLGALLWSLGGYDLAIVTAFAMAALGGAGLAAAGALARA